MIREQLRKELSKLAAEGWEDRQTSRDSRGSRSSWESTSWELLEEPTWKCTASDVEHDFVSVPDFGASEADFDWESEAGGLDVRVSTQIARVAASAFAAYSRCLGQGRFPLAVLGGGAVAFITGLLLGRGIRRSP